MKLLAAMLLLLALAPAAHGEAVGLRDDPQAAEIALAGQDVLVARELLDWQVQLDAVPRAGGAPRTLLAVPSARVAYGGSAGNALAIDSTRLRGNRVRVRVHCVATPTDACRGTLLLKHGERVVTSGPFTVPAGVWRRVPVALTRRGLRVARREGSFIVDARVPDGRVGVGGHGSSELGVEDGR